MEFETHGFGFYSRVDEFHNLQIPRDVLPLMNVRITNHETDRRVSLTFHARMPVTGVPWPGLNPTPVGRLTPMPIDLGPLSSLGLDIEFSRPHLPRGATGGVLLIDVEDHLSGLRTPIPTGGTWRPARDGEWQNPFPPAPQSPQAREDAFVLLWLRQQERETQSIAAWIAGGLVGQQYNEARTLVDDWARPITRRLLAYDSQLAELFNDDGDDHFGSPHPGEALNRRLEQLRKVIAEVERRQ